MAQPSHIAGFLSLNNVLPYSLLCTLGDLLPSFVEALSQEWVHIWEHPTCLKSSKSTKLVALGLSPGTAFLVKQMGVFPGC